MANSNNFFRSGSKGGRGSSSKLRLAPARQKPADGEALVLGEKIPASEVAKQQEKRAGKPRAPKAAAEAGQKGAAQKETARPAAEKRPAASRKPRSKAQTGQPAAKQGKAPAAQSASRTRAAKDNAPASRRQSTRGRSGSKAPTIKVIPLGGLNEIGKNLTVFEYRDDIIIVDCGLAFPDDEMLGIDLVIPDVTYLEKNADKIRGIFLTHGHEDHIGSLPYVLRKINVPVYGTRLTLGLVEGKLREHNMLNKTTRIVVKPGDKIKLGEFEVEIIHSTHSIADAVMLAIKSPAGVIVHTGDFKIDCTPIGGQMIDLARLGQLGKEGVLLLMSDSTNAERPGYTMSERKVGASFNNLFQQAEGKRIVIATFSSNIHRVQQIFDCAAKYNRKVAVSGRSMVNVIGVAMELGYLNVPDGLVIDIDAINRYPKDELVIITTGSQGEPMSALYRMAFSDHRKVEIGPDDCIIISANPIPGNEKLVGRVINELLKLGAKVLYESIYEVHVSGHACQEEQKIILGLTQPKYFMPVHGEYKHLVHHAATARSMGYDDDHIMIADIGKVVEVSQDSCKITGTVPAGRLLIDGLGVGDVGSIVLRDRKHLAEDGLIVVVAAVHTQGERRIVSGPDIVSRGFVYVREAEELMEQAKRVAEKALEGGLANGNADWTSLKNTVRDAMSEFIFSKTKRRPMVLPILMDA